MREMEKALGGTSESIQLNSAYNRRDYNGLEIHVEDMMAFGSNVLAKHRSNPLHMYITAPSTASSSVGMSDKGICTSSTTLHLSPVFSLNRGARDQEAWICHQGGR